MTPADREGVKAAFNDPEAPVRVLIATDAASEGLNLHRTARCLLHYDCLWNPSRLEQRNGRLDRYGQGRDVTVRHFVSDADDDLRFLAHMIAKANDIRKDLGTVNELFDRAAHRRLIEGRDLVAVQAELDAGLAGRGAGSQRRLHRGAATRLQRRTLHAAHRRPARLPAPPRRAADASGASADAARVRRALGVLARRRYPGERQVSRWTARRGDVPSGAEAVVLLSVEELAVNALRETFRCWVRTVAFPVRDGTLGEPLPHAWARQHRGGDAVDAAATERAADILEDAHAHLRDWLADYQRALTERLRRQLEADHAAARSREDERYRQRQGEVSALIEQSTLARLAREVEALAVKRQQGQLFDEAGRLAALERSAEEKRQELARRRQHYEELREQARVLDHLLPQRFALAGTAQAFPAAAEVRLAE